MAALGALLGCSWLLLGILGAVFGHLWASLGSSWAALGGPWAILWRMEAILDRVGVVWMSILGGFGIDSDGFGVHLGFIWGWFGANLGLICG